MQKQSIRFAVALLLACALGEGHAQEAHLRVDPLIPTAPDCLEEAADFHHVNPWVLRAIIWHESRNKPGIVLRNRNGSVDIGYGGINSVHYGELGTFKVAPEQLLDACVNTYVAAWLLSKKVKKHGNTWEAIGAYHSETESLKWVYVGHIRRVLASWRIVPLQ